MLGILQSPLVFEVVASATGVSIQTKVRRRLVADFKYQLSEERVFDDVCEVTRVELMTISEHKANCTRDAATLSANLSARCAVELRSSAGPQLSTLLALGV